MSPQGGGGFFMTEYNNINDQNRSAERHLPQHPGNQVAIMHPLKTMTQ